MSKAVAEYMGYNYYPQSPAGETQIAYPGWKKYKEASPLTSNNYLRSKERDAYLCQNVAGMRYHISFEWIMPVIIRISLENFVDFKTGKDQHGNITTAIFIHSDIDHTAVVFIHRKGELTSMFLLEAAYWYTQYKKAGDTHLEIIKIANAKN